MILTEVHLLESRVYRGIGNLAKAKVNTYFLYAHDLDAWTTGSLDVRTDSSECYILPSPSPSCTRPPIWGSPCRR